MAESISLAVLENLVHMEKKDFQVGYVSVPDEFNFLLNPRHPEFRKIGVEAPVGLFSTSACSVRNDCYFSGNDDDLGYIQYIQ